MPFPRFAFLEQNPIAQQQQHTEPAKCGGSAGCSSLVVARAALQRTLWAVKAAAAHRALWAVTAAAAPANDRRARRWFQQPGLCAAQPPPSNCS